MSPNAAIAGGSSKSPGAPWHARRSVHVATIAAWATILYAPTLRGTFDFDTPNLLLYNPAVHGFSLANLRAVLTGLPNGVEYLPVRDLTYMLDFELWGMRAFGFHLSNVVLYVGCCALLYVLLERSLSGWSERPRLLAWIATLLFASHAVHVESVAGIAQRKDVVSGILCFASLIAFHAWVTRRAWWVYALALALLVLATLAKATAIVVPGLAVLVTARHALRERRVQLGALGLAAASALLTVALAAHAMHVGILFDDPVPVWARALTYGKVAVWYGRMLLVPWPLSTIHDVAPVVDPLDPQGIAALAGVVASAILAARLRRRWPVIALSVAWFLVSIAPVSGLLPAPNLVAERYLFIPSIGFVVAVASVLLDVVAVRSRALAAAAAAALVVGHTAVVIGRVGEWHTNGGLLAADLSRNPRSARLAGLLGRYHYGNGRYAEAFALFDRAHRLDPANRDGEIFAALQRIESGDPAGALERLGPTAGEQIVDVQCLLGMALERMGRREEARSRYEQALHARRLMGVMFRTDAEAGLARLDATGR